MKKTRNGMINNFGCDIMVMMENNSNIKRKQGKEYLAKMFCAKKYNKQQIEDELDRIIGKIHRTGGCNMDFDFEGEYDELPMKGIRTINKYIKEYETNIDKNTKRIASMLKEEMNKIQ